MAGPCSRGSKTSVVKLFRCLYWKLRAENLHECEKLFSNNFCRSFSSNQFPLSSSKSFNKPVNLGAPLTHSRSMSVYVTSHLRAGDLHILRATAGSLNSHDCQPHRHISGASLKKSPTHYYDVLGLTPSASQKQIKTAYYEMSKLHHPDVTECTKSHSLYTEINEAYEVLGNIRKRRMYDKGAYNVQGHRMHDDQEDEDDYTQAYRGNSNFERGNRPPPPTGRSKIYNFDEFYRQHYNDMRERKANEFREYVKYQEMMRQRASNQASEVPVSMLIVAWIVLMFSLLMIYEQGHDEDVLQNSGMRTARANNRKYDSLESIPDSPPPER